MIRRLALLLALLLGERLVAVDHRQAPPPLLGRAHGRRWLCRGAHLLARSGKVWRIEIIDLPLRIADGSAGDRIGLLALDRRHARGPARRRDGAHPGAMIDILRRHQAVADRTGRQCRRKQDWQGGTPEKGKERHTYRFRMRPVIGKPRFKFN